MKNKFYITAAIPYVNAKPHIGHALEFVQTDVLARYYQALGYEVLSLSGGDENALKNVQAADNEEVPVDKFVSKNTELFRQLSIKLDVDFDVWQKGSSKKHHLATKKLWRLCGKNGDIYKKRYKGLYCVGCEAFYSPDELDEQGECPEHPGKKLEVVEEENYFFKLSKYQDQLIKLVEKDELKIIPEFRKNEVLSFLKSGLHDLSISRSNERAKNWGVQVPGDDKQRVYVWFDALNIYQSGIGFGWNDKKYKKWWPADLHVIGKGIVRFHAVYWPAFLLSAGLKLPKNIFVHEYITVDGKKMGKSIGNVYNPLPLIDKFGADPLRYYLLSKISPFIDGDFSEEKFLSAYNADLANSLGNTVQRVAKLCNNSKIGFQKVDIKEFSTDVKKKMDEYRFDLALGEIWKDIAKIEKELEIKKPWNLKGDELKSTLENTVSHLRKIGFDLKPFLPETAKKITKIFKGPQISSPKPIFPRI